MAQSKISVYNLDRDYILDDDIYTLGLYQFNEASGVIVDKSTNGRNLSPVGGITYAQPSLFGSAILLDGTSGYLTGQSFLNVARPQLTVEAIINPTEVLDSTNGIVLLSCGNTTNGIICGLDDKLGNIFFRIYASSVLYNMTIPFGGVLPGEWVHISMTFNAGTVTLYRNARIYLSGVLPIVEIPAVATTLYVGYADASFGFTSGYFAGKFCEFRVSNIERSEKELSLSADRLFACMHLIKRQYARDYGLCPLRNKWLSISRLYAVFADALLVDGSLLPPVGGICPGLTCTLVSITAKGTNNLTKLFHIRVGGIDIMTFNLVNGYYSNLQVNLDIDALNVITVFVDAAGLGVRDPSVILELAWRM